VLAPKLLDALAAYQALFAKAAVLASSPALSSLVPLAGPAEARLNAL